MSLLDILKNRKLILEGITNNLFKKEHVEAIAGERWAICKECKYLSKDSKGCSIPGTELCCSDCGCSLGFKLRSLSSSCPKEYWDALMTEEEEDKLEIPEENEQEKQNE